jgi:hypothetical protein
MAEKIIWNGSSTFTTGSTPFRFYEDDPVFQADADRVADFCARKLGWPMLEVELTSGSFYTCFEEAVTTYGNEVFQYKIRENYISLEGLPTSTDLTSTLVQPSLYRMIQISKNYGTEAGVGGDVSKYSGSIDLQEEVQNYDLNAWSTAEGITGSIEIRRVFYEAPPAIVRYFDPYAGTGTGVQSLMDAFNFGTYSPGINFLLMPASFDILKTQAIEFNDQIRRSAYSFEIVNNMLKVFPIPKSGGKLWFEYYKASEREAAAGVSSNGGVDVVTNVAEVPYSNPVYGSINSIGRQWIFRYAAALAREMLGYVRGKYTTVPVPGSEVTLNAADLLADGRSEREALLTTLREMLDQTSRSAQLERKKNENDYLRDTLQSIPLTIYVG